MIPIKTKIYPIGIKKKNGSISNPSGAIEELIFELIKQKTPKINGKI